MRVGKRRRDRASGNATTAGRVYVKPSAGSLSGLPVSHPDKYIYSFGNMRISQEKWEIFRKGNFKIKLCFDEKEHF